MVKLCASAEPLAAVASAQFVSPAWLAVTVHVPEARMVTAAVVVPALSAGAPTEHTLAVPANDTWSPLDAVALTLNEASPYVLSAREVNVIVWAARLMASAPSVYVML